MEDWKVTINRVHNGYIADFTGGDSPGKCVYENGAETETGELDSLRTLLWDIKDFFGVYHSKHSKYNLVVEVEKTYEEPYSD